MHAGFAINSLIKETVNGDTKTYRVLWTDGKLAYVYDIDEDGYSWPYAKKVNDIKWAIYMGQAIKLETDPFCRTVINEKDLSGAAVARRDYQYSIIEEMISAVPDIFLRHKRGKLVRKAIERFKVSKVSVYSILKKFWRGGQVKDALIPNFDKCGGPDIPKRAGDKKRGANNVSGINIGEEDKKNIKKALKKYYNKGTSLYRAYLNMLIEDYNVDIRYDDKHQKYVILDDTCNCPTYDQFKYWHKQLRDIKEEEEGRKGKHKVLLDQTPRLGSSTDRILGPGYEFQIDSTIGDVYLLSAYNPDWIIGRPVIYIVIDLFSEMIVGLYVGLEGPSWIGQMMAIANCVEDKVSYCNNYGVPIKPGEWPCHHFPSKLMGDRGEHASEQSKRLNRIWGLQIDIAAPYRPDWKGLVENMFKLLSDQTTQALLPGQVIKADILEKRKGAKYRLDATLTVDEFTALMIGQVRKFNKRRLKDYPLDIEMLESGVKPIPIELFTWGALERPYYLKEYPEDLVKLSLMPTGTAAITNQGLSFEGFLLYSSESTMDDITLAAIKKKSQEIAVCYDPRNMNKIYIPAPDGRSYRVCELLPQLKQYCDKSLEDIRYLKKHKNTEWRSSLDNIYQNEADEIMGSKQIVETAVKRKKSFVSATSKSKRLKEIPINRKFEKSARRSGEVFELGEKVDKPVTPEPAHEFGTEDTARSRLLEKLRKKQKELADE